MSEIKKYRSSEGYHLEIKVVTVERETADSVWVDGRRFKKQTGYENYFDTFEQAKAHLLAIVEKEVERARTNLNRANDRLGTAKGLHER